MRRSVNPLALLTLLLPLVVAGCGDGTAGPSKEPVKRGPHELVLRTMTVGGVAGLGRKGSMPDLSVYGDGRVIARGEQPTQPIEYRLTRKAHERLIADAREAGLGTPRTIDDPGIADAVHLRITFTADAADAGGTSRKPVTTQVIKMGAHGAGVLGFAETRLDPRRWPAADLAVPAKPYEPTTMAVLATENSTAGTGRPWPFTTALGSGPPVGAQSCTVLTGADLVKAQRLTDETTWRDHGRT